jgi:hypothetical protein
MNTPTSNLSNQIYMANIMKREDGHLCMVKNPNGFWICADRKFNSENLAETKLDKPQDL